MKYFLDSEFIEDGSTIDLLSIGIVADDGRELYRQNSQCSFHKAGDWVWRNVFPHLEHFRMSGTRSCCEPRMNTPGDRLTGKCGESCPWSQKWEIRDAVRAFCNPEVHGKPEFWGYYAAYDWVAFCQLFGCMVDLPKGYPMYCRDIKQLCDSLGNPELPKSQRTEHNALNDARQVRAMHGFLINLLIPPRP